LLLMPSAPREEDVRRLIQELTRGILQGQLSNLRHYAELRTLVETGAVDQRTVSEAFRAYVREVSPDYGQRLNNLSVRYYADLLALGNEFSSRFYERVLGGVGGTRAPNGAKPPPVPMELSGPVGGHAEGRFELVNERADAVDVSYLVSPLRGPDGSVFRPIVSFTPTQAKALPSEVLSVTIRVVLEPDMFVPHRIYTGTVEIAGFPDTVLALSVWAAAVREPEPRRTTKPGARKPRATPRKTTGQT
jgi:hypothetical protein